MTAEEVTPRPSPESGSDDDQVRGYFPEHYVVSPAGPDGRHNLFDPYTRRRWMLGAAELAAARQFTAGQTYASLARALNQRGARSVSVGRLRAFEAKLLAVCLLRQVDILPPGSRKRVGARLAGLRWLGGFGLVAFHPGRAVDAVYGRTPWLTSWRGTLGLAAFAVAVVVMLGSRAGTLAHQVPSAIAGWGLPGLYLLTAVSAIFHEGGHALACRRYGVAVEEIGLGVRALILFAWTDPDRDGWARLSTRARLATVAAGPFGSVLYGTLGGVLWLSTPAGGVPSRIAVLWILAGTVAVLPTLLPIFQGDTYLILTDMLGWPNLRPRALAELRHTLRRTPRTRRPAGRTRAGYLCFAVVVVVGHLAVTGFVLWLIWFCDLARPGG
ncbi:MAG TPA: M50 family metallopeptidase [Mycobacteriales bacterium]|nr:M50 family metallopeptidase [Mycobacteriales bacterium]